MTFATSPFTDKPEASPSIVFPRESLRLLTLIIFLLSLMTLFYILGRRTSNLNPLSRYSWRQWNIARLSCLMVYILSAAYVFGALVLTFGTGLDKTSQTCNIGTLLCLCFYTCSKFWLYLFLLERVRIVQPVKKRRLKSKLYVGMLVMVTIPCCIFLILMIFGRRHDIDGHGACHMGLELYSSLPVLGFDVVLVGFLTAMFCMPLIRSRNETVSPMIRRVAIRSLIASFTSVLTTMGNVIFLAIEHRKLGWLCLLTCCSDIVISAIVLFAVTTRSDDVESSNGNTIREQAAILAISKGASYEGPDRGRTSEAEREQTINMMEILRGELVVERASLGRPSLRCTCSSSSLGCSEEGLDRRESDSMMTGGGGNEHSQDTLPPAALSYQASTSSTDPSKPESTFMSK